jgi:hypothetical protein
MFLLSLQPPGAKAEMAMVGIPSNILKRKKAPDAFPLPLKGASEADKRIGLRNT